VRRARSLSPLLLWGSIACRAELTAPLPPENEPTPAPSCSDAALPFPHARLLTRTEYRRTVFDLLHEPNDPTLAFPAEPEVNGFNNNAASYQATPALVEELAKTARALRAAAAARGLDQIVSCTGLDEATCTEYFVSEFGRRAFRRPLATEEHARFVELHDAVQASSNHLDALGAVVETALLSPQFLYRIEAPLEREGLLVEPESPPLDGYALGRFELAARLSYFIWGSMPDDELLQHAEEGLLSTPAGLDAEVQRLLASPKSADRISEFHAQWLGAPRLKSLMKNDTPPEAGAAWSRSLTAFVDDIFMSGGGVGRLLSDPRVLVDSVLAPLYGYPIPESGTMAWVTPTEPRPGLLAQPGLLALFALPNQSSPIRRGVFVRKQLLCENVPNPPPSVNPTPPDPAPGLTTRERFRVHTQNPECANCHDLIDPVGFGFEAYDEVGRYRTTEDGRPVDTSGTLAGLKDKSLEGSFQNLNELASRISQGSTVLECIGTKWFEFGLGRPPSGVDGCKLREALAQGGPETPLSELVMSVVRSSAFRLAPLATPETPTP
jgi:hypothetical protein